MMQDVLTGRFDTPDDPGLTHVEERFQRVVRSTHAYPRESETLMTLRQREGEFYTLVADPPGDKLTVELYRGPFGVFKVAAGDKKLDKPISFQGTFYGPKAFLNMASSRTKPDDKKMAECKLPVGDYASFYMTINYGGLQVGVSNNYYSQNRAAAGSTEQHAPQGVQIREDKPFVLDFSGKPEATFQAPPADKPIKLGTDVRIATVLIDPKSDILLRANRSIEDEEGDGEVSLLETVSASTPTIKSFPTIPDLTRTTITSPSGKNVAEGVMPFG